MKQHIVPAFLAAAFVILGSAAHAQTIDPQCPSGSFDSGGKPDNTEVAQDACQKAIDLFQYMAPQLGMVLAGGSPNQGVSGTLGGFGHFSFGIRANLLHASLPQIDRVVPNTRGARVDIYPIETRMLGFATADASVGLTKGTATSGFGAIDLLVSLSYVPEFKSSAVDVTVPSPFKVGFGAKVGILRESAVRPGISVSYLSRGLPYVNITGKSGEDRLTLDSVNVSSRSWRLEAGKKFAILGFGAGVGRDTYDSRGRISVIVAPREATEGGTGGPISLVQKISRNNVFGTMWLGGKTFSIVGEIGRVFGGSVTTYNSFDGPVPDSPRTFSSIGLSFTH
jgi:hypothetical protein